MQLRYEVTTVNDGNVDPKFGDTKQVIENRKGIFLDWGIESDFVRMKPNNGPVILVVTEDILKSWIGQYDGGRPEVDTLITNVVGLALECDPADCGVYGLFHENLILNSMVHSGREGSIGRNLERSIEYTANLLELQVRRYAEGLVVHESPMICGDCYQQDYLEIPSEDFEMWEEFVRGEYKVDEEDGVKKLIARNGEKIGLDFRGFNRSRLIDIGVLEENIIKNNICTYEDQRYFSHAQAKEAGNEGGRFMVAAWMSE